MVFITQAKNRLADFVFNSKQFQAKPGVALQTPLALIYERKLELLNNSSVLIDTCPKVSLKKSDFFLHKGL